MNALTTQSAAAPAPAPRRKSMLMDMQAFDHMVRVGRMLAMSPLFPAHLRGGSIEQGTANGVLVLNMADRLGEDELTVAQNIYFVGGRPGWNTTYMIAKANQHGVFKDVIDWDVIGKGETLSVTAFGILRTTGKRVQVTVTMEMAKKEGWTKNAKYQSIPEQMLRYRSAAFLIRLYCPEVMVGVPVAVELELEARDITPDGGPVIEANDEPAVEGMAAEQTAAKAAPSEQQKEAKREQKPAEEGKSGNDKPEGKAREEAKGAGAAEGQASLLPDDKVADTTSEEKVDKAEASAPSEEEVERYSNVAGLIVADIQNGTAPDEIDQLYGPQIEIINARHPELMEVINQAFVARQQGSR